MIRRRDFLQRMHMPVRTGRLVKMDFAGINRVFLLPSGQLDVSSTAFDQQEHTQFGGHISP